MVSLANEYIYENKSNFLLGITGPVGVGKSHTAVHLGYMWRGKKFKLEESLCYSVEEFLDRSMMAIKIKGKRLNLEYIQSIDDVTKWLNDNRDFIKITPGRVVILDEAGTAANVREFFSLTSRTLGKILQIFRFLRLFVMFVVPSKMNLADSMIARFLNAEMRVVSKTRQFAKLVCWEYIGWNEKHNQPIKKRIRGNKRVGWFLVPKMNKYMMGEYENVSRIYKTGHLVDFSKGLNLPISGIGKRRTLEDIVKDVDNNREKFQNKTGLIDWRLVKYHYKTSRDDAQTIEKVLNTRNLSHVNTSTSTLYK